ncbi:spore coat protein [Bacillus suaedae]|uniref:Spore coat protein n=1 Tax=Halalkalibacter suaedae TaxID=2822140 RepID=A0A940WS78_9BACI|nr:spore coat protein [Bacillus suaedae]MBP3950813.1 spore coat protein [Bacillus suaedae]
MPNNIKDRGLTDREMIQLCLELEKGRARSISSTILETSHEELRDIYKQLYTNATDSQYQLYEIMNQKGWYKTAIASIEQINQVEKFMQNNLHPDSQFK